MITEDERYEVMNNISVNTEYPWLSDILKANHYLIHVFNENNEQPIRDKFKKPEFGNRILSDVLYDNLNFLESGNPIITELKDKITIKEDLTKSPYASVIQFKGEDYENKERFKRL